MVINWSRMGWKNVADICNNIAFTISSYYIIVASGLSKAVDVYGNEHMCMQQCTSANYCQQSGFFYHEFEEV